MKKSGLKNILSKAVVSVLLIVSFVSCTSVQETRSLEELYDAAMLDALYATPDEIRPLVVIVPGSDMVSWNEDGDKILMISWNDKPELYEEKSTYKVEDDPIWTFTDKEILSWYDENGKEVESWPIRFKQLIGLPEDSEYTHFTAFWCDSSELLRPAYDREVFPAGPAEESPRPGGPPLYHVLCAGQLGHLRHLLQLLPWHHLRSYDQQGRNQVQEGLPFLLHDLDRRPEFHLLDGHRHLA